MARGMLTRNLLREIRHTRARFISIVLISMLGVAFFAGIRATCPDMLATADAFFDGSRMADVLLVSTTGFDADDLALLRSQGDVEAVQPTTSFDTLMDHGGDTANVKAYSLPQAESPNLWQDKPAQLPLPEGGVDIPEVWVNQPMVTQGRLPENDYECAVDERLLTHEGVQVGQTVTFHGYGASRTMAVVGVVRSPLYIALDRGSSTVGTGVSNGFAYMSAAATQALGPKLPLESVLTTRYTQLSLTLVGMREMDGFSQAYDAAVDAACDRLEALAPEGATWYALDRNAYNTGYGSFHNDADRVQAIARLFPLIFFVVAALVSLTTMTRMVEEQRTQIGTLKALGYGAGTIAGEYIAYALLASVTGSLLGAAIGFKLFPAVIYNAYSIMYSLPPLQMPYDLGLTIVATLAMSACTCLAAVWACYRALLAMPAQLMRPRAPKAGKRIFLERIPAVWSRCSFSRKVTFRNLLRYKKRFWMSVIGIAGSCALLLTGFGLHDSIFSILDRQFGGIWTYDMRAVASEGMDEAALEALQSAVLSPGGRVAQAAFAYEQTMSALGATGEGEEFSVYLLAPREPNGLAGMIRLQRAGQEAPLTDEGVLVSQKLAEKLGLSPGSTLVLRQGATDVEVPVAGIVEQYVYHYVYISRALYEQAFGQPLPCNEVLLTLTDNTQANREDVAQDLLSGSDLNMVSSLADTTASMDDTLSSINVIVVVLIVCSALLMFVVMHNLTNINITERKRELATLEVLGFRDRERYDYIFRENNLLTLIGIVLGLGLGVVLHQFVAKTAEIDMVAFVKTIQPLSYLYAVVLTLVFSRLVNRVMRPIIREVDMVESLKSVE